MNVTDSFNRANSSTALGTTSDGHATWAALSGTWGILSNQAYLATGSGGDDLAVVDPGSADGVVQVTVASVSSGWDVGIAFRASDASNFWRLEINNGSAFSGFYKAVGGSVSNVGGTFTWTVGDVLKVDMTGSTLKGYRNGSLVTTITDSFNSTATKHGVYGNISNATLDDWSFTAPVAAPFRPPAVHVAQRAALIRGSRF